MLNNRDKSESKSLSLYHAPNPYHGTSPTGFKIIDGLINGITAIPNGFLGKTSSMVVLPAQFTIPVGDGVIPHKASLHETVKNSPCRGDNCFKMFAPSTISGRSGHNAARKELLSTNDDPVLSSMNPHQEVEVQGIALDGQDVFDAFVRRVTRTR